MAQTGLNTEQNKNTYKKNNNFINFYHINNSHHGTSYTEGNSTFSGTSSSNINVKNNYYNINITTNNNICNINYNNTFNQTNTTDSKSSSYEEENDTKSINPSTSNQHKPTTSDCNCLRIHIVKDLQEQNIQIPKELLTPKKCCHKGIQNGCHYIFQESLFPHSSDNRHRVFGVELSRLPSTLSSGLPIPKVLHEMLSILSSKGDHKGIFRLSGSKLRIRALKEVIESTGSVPKDCRAVDLACILKQFLHQLPSPLLPPPILELLTSINSLTPSTDRRCYLIFEACLLMPPLHLFTLKAILKYLKNVAEHYEITLMTSASLSICLLPSITRIQADESAFNTKRFKEHVEVMSFLINYHQHLGNIHLFKNVFSKFPLSNFSHFAFDTFQEKNHFEIENKLSSKKFKRKSCSKKHKLNTTVVEDKENTLLNKSFFNFNNHNTTFFKKSNLTSIFRKSHKKTKKDTVPSTNTTALNNTNEDLDNNFDIDNNNTINVFNFTAPTFKNAAVKRKFDLFSNNMSIRASKKMKLLNVFAKQHKELSNETSYLPRKSRSNILKKIFEKMRKKKTSLQLSNEEDIKKLNKTNVSSKEGPPQTNDTTYSFSTSLLNNDNNFSLLSNAGNYPNITNNSILDKYTFNYGQNESHNYSFDFIRKNKNVLKNKKYQNKMAYNKQKNHRTSHKQLLDKTFESDSQKKLCNKYTGLVRKIDFDDYNSMDELGGFDETKFNVTNNYYSDDNYYHKYNVGVGESDDDEVFGMPRKIENILEEDEENILDKGMLELPALDDDYYDDTEEEDNDDETKKNDLFNNATTKLELLSNESEIEKCNEVSFKSCGRKKRKTGQRLYGIVDDNAFEVSNLSFKLSQGLYCKAENAEVCFNSSKESVKNSSETNSCIMERNCRDISNNTEDNKFKESLGMRDAEEIFDEDTQWRKSFLNKETSENNHNKSSNTDLQNVNDSTVKNEMYSNMHITGSVHISNFFCDNPEKINIDQLMCQHENLENNNLNNNAESSLENHSNSLDSGLDILDTALKTPSSPSSSSSSPF